MDESGVSLSSLGEHEEGATWWERGVGSGGFERSEMGEDGFWIVEKHANLRGEEGVRDRHARCRRWRGHRRQGGAASNFNLADTPARPCADGWHGAKFVLAPDGFGRGAGELNAGRQGHQRHQCQSGGDFKGRSFAEGRRQQDDG